MNYVVRPYQGKWAIFVAGDKRPMSDGKATKGAALTVARLLAGWRGTVTLGAR